MREKYIKAASILINCATDGTELSDKDKRIIKMALSDTATKKKRTKPKLI